MCIRDRYKYFGIKTSLVVQSKVHGGRFTIWSCAGKNGGDLMVSYPGDVSIPEFSHVRRHWFCGGNSDDLNMAHKKIPDKKHLRRTDTTLQNKIFKRPGIWRFVVRFWLGHNRRLSRAPLCFDWKRGNRYHYNFIKCRCRHLGIWFFQRETSALKLSAHEGNKIIVVSAFAGICLLYRNR